MVNEEDLEARPTLISVGLTIPKKKTLLLSILIHARDERATKVRFREKVAPEQRTTLFGIVSFVLRHILEVPFILGLDYYLLQVDLTVIVEEHHELPPWDKTRHRESIPIGVSLPHVEPMKT